MACVWGPGLPSSPYSARVWEVSVRFPAQEHLWSRYLTYINGNDSILLIRKETACVIGISHGAPRKDKSVFFRREKRDRLVDPMIQVIRRRMTPVLVTGDIGGWVVLVVEMPSAVSVPEHAIRIIHKMLWWREVNLRPISASIVSCNRHTGRYIRVYKRRRSRPRSILRKTNCGDFKRAEQAH